MMRFFFHISLALLLPLSAAQQCEWLSGLSVSCALNFGSFLVDGGYHSEISVPRQDFEVQISSGCTAIVRRDNYDANGSSFFSQDMPCLASEEGTRRMLSCNVFVGPAVLTSTIRWEFGDSEIHASASHSNIELGSGAWTANCSIKPINELGNP